MCFFPVLWGNLLSANFCLHHLNITLCILNSGVDPGGNSFSFASYGLIASGANGALTIASNDQNFTSASIATRSSGTLNGIVKNTTASELKATDINIFTREGKHLHYDLYISISEAALGVSKDIHLIDGKVRIKLESGIQSGKTLRLRNKGIPDLNGYSKGDLLVHVNIWTPKTLNKKQKDFFKEMLDDDNFKPNPNKTDKSFFEKVRDMFA